MQMSFLPTPETGDVLQVPLPLLLLPLQQLLTIQCLKEVQGIAQSTLFGPVVRREAIQAKLSLQCGAQADGCHVAMCCVWGLIWGYILNWRSWPTRVQSSAVRRKNGIWSFGHALGSALIVLTISASTSSKGYLGHAE